MEGDKEAAGRYFKERPESRDLVMDFNGEAKDLDGLSDTLVDFVQHCGDAYKVEDLAIERADESYRLRVTAEALEAEFHEMAATLAYIIQEEDMHIPNGPVAYQLSLPASIRAKIESNHENFHRI